jgi:hypothetical protein
MFTGRAMHLGRNYQTRSARSGATIVRHDCLSKAFWPRLTRLLIIWRPIFAVIFLRRRSFHIFASRFTAKNAPEYAAKLFNRERAISYLHPPPGSVIVSAHSLATCPLIEARHRKGVVQSRQAGLAMLFYSHQGYYPSRGTLVGIFQRSRFTL